MTAPQPLAGYRVLDFCWMIAGPLGTRLIADLGAEVIKVESLARRDIIREVGAQPPGMLTPDTNGVFHDCNASKRSLMLNLGHPEGIRIAKELVRHSDIVTSNYTHDRMDRWGLGYDDLRAIREDIIVVSMPVMGGQGCHRDWRAVGNGVIAMAGLGAHTGFPGRAPVGLGTFHSDFTTPYFSALQILAAVYERELTGKGQFIELAQYEASVQLLDTELLEYLVNGEIAPRQGNRSREHVPHGVYRCAGEDRWIAIAVRSGAEWVALCEVLGLRTQAADPALAGVEGRRAAERAIDAAIGAATAGRDAWELAAALQARGVPASPVEDIRDMLTRDASLADYYQESAHPAGVTILQQHEPVLWDGERVPLQLGPLLGEHTGQVLADLLGYSDEQIGELVAEGVLY